LSCSAACDPGTKGGIAVLAEDGTVLMARAFYPKMPAIELKAWIEEALAHKPAGFFLEKVGHKRGDGSRGSFTFGGAYRLVEGILLGQGVVPKYVPPAFWQARLECLSGGNKAITHRRAKFLFGNQIKVTRDIADALLIAEYGRRSLLA